MKKQYILLVIPSLILFNMVQAMNPDKKTSDEKSKPGYIIEHDADVATKQPGPHEGGGETTGHSFFKAVQDMDFVFKKRVLHPGSAIGYHLQENDEIYYILSGEGELNMDGKKSIVGAGTAILTRPGTHHSIHQSGSEDLVIFIIYPRH